MYIKSHAQKNSHAYKSALQGFTSCLEVFPKNVDLMLLKADLLIQLGDQDQALKLYRIVRKAEPMLIDSMDKYAGLVCDKDGKVNKSVLINRLAEELLNVSDTRPECYVILARFSQLNNAFDRALIFLEKVC